MSKNLTRKGLALGAAVALGSTLFAGVPAQAATALYLDTAFGTSGTTQNGILGEYFVLAGSAAGATTTSDIKYYIEGVANADVTVKSRFVTDLTSNAAYGTTEGTVDVSTASKQTTVDIDAANWSVGSYYQFGIKINSTNVTSTTTIKVTPFVDSVISDNKPGANELVGTPVSITFHKASELTATPTLKALTLGAVAKATVALDKSVNLEQLRAAANGAVEDSGLVKVTFKENGADFGTTGQVVRWNTTDKEFVTSSSGNVAASNVYGAQAIIGSTNSGTAPLVTAGAVDVTALSAVVAARNTSYQTSGDDIRAGAGTLSVSTTATVSAGKSKSGQKVTFTIAEGSANSLDAAASVTAGGKTLTNSATGTIQDIKVEVLTDADGKASLEIAYTGVKAVNQLVISAAATGTTSVTATALTVDAEDSVATAIVDSVKSANASAVRRIAKGGAISIDYVLVDQFGATPVGDFQIVVTEDSANANFTANLPVVAGKVTFNGADNSTADNNYNVTATVQKKNTSGNWEAIGGGLAVSSAISLGAAATASSITASATATTGVARDLVTYVAGNTDVEQGSVTRSAVSGGTTITGSVIGTNGGNLPGAVVTLSSANLLFVAGTVNAIGSITVVADANGAIPTVYVYSNKGGKQTVTLTSGSATKTVDITFAAVTAGGSAWTLEAPASVNPGKTVTITATLKDKYGNVVDTAADDVKVAYEGPGFVTAQLPTQTDSDGKLSFTVLLGASDTGTAKVTVTYEGANGTIAETTGNDDVVATSSIVIAAPVVVVPEVKTTIVGVTKALRVRVENAKGEEVEIVVGGKTVRVATAGTNSKLWVINTTKGKKSVKVYVDGDLVAVKTVTVK